MFRQAFVRSLVSVVTALAASLALCCSANDSDVEAVEETENTEDSAGALAGIISHFDAFTIQTYRVCITTNVCMNRNRFSVSGWAFNPNTAPVQDVHIRVSGTLRDGTLATFKSPVFVANRSRTDVATRYHLSSP